MTGFSNLSALETLKFSRYVQNEGGRGLLSA
jgi:hypothetical protein